MGKFDGKKLLVLGTSVGSVEIVKYARAEGAYVIVTDYLSTEKSAAKQYADETAMISTVDVERLCEFGKEKKIDGVFCGVSEVNLASVNAIAYKLGLPCYFTKEQWELCGNKAEFNALCRKYGLPVAKKYEMGNPPTKEELDAICYPVIVKPVDQSAAIGIHICENKEQLLAGYRDAHEKSFCGKVIVEQYIVGDEFSAAFTIIDGKYALSTIGDKYLNREQIGLIPLPEAYVYPSKHLRMFQEKLESSVVEMFKSIGLENGTVFVQGVTDGVNTTLFEAGLRMGGTALFRFVSNINGINILHLLTEYALTGKMGADITLEDPSLKGKRCCLLSLLNGGGKIAEINGVESASQIPGVVESVVRYREGETIAKSGTLKQSHIRFFVVRDTAQELVETIETIQDAVSVLDEAGHNMLLAKFDAKKLVYEI